MAVYLRDSERIIRYAFLIRLRHKRRYAMPKDGDIRLCLVGTEN
jgi:hypothetical protein